MYAISYSLCHEDMGEWRYSCAIFDLSTRWKWMVNFMPLLLYRQGRRPQYPLDKKLGGPQSQSGCCGEQKNLALRGIEPGLSE
jgi:hypothetical protein